ncbi:hypothetical protein RFI_34665, partial [Reticulomyxa filosa]
NSQGFSRFFSNPFAKQKSPYVYIVQHLMESIRDEESFQFALSAIRDMDTTLQTQIDDLQSLLKEKIQQFDKGTSIFESVYQFVFLCERMGDQRRQWLSPWQLFLAVQSIVKIANCAMDKRVDSILLSELKSNINGQWAGNHPKAEHFNLFVLIPCFNLLTRTSDSEIKQNMLFRFRFQHIQKVEQMDQKCMDVIETDLKLRQVVGDNVKLFAEEQLIHVLNSCKDDTLSEAMLEFLMDNSLMTANSWKRMWSINNTICWNVIYGVYKHHIEKWSPFVAHLCKNNALQDEQVRKALFKGFNEKLFQTALIKSEDDFLLFIGFIVQNKSAMYSILTLYLFLSLYNLFENSWQTWEAVLETMQHYIDTDIIYGNKTAMAIFELLWVVKNTKNCNFLLTTEGQSPTFWLQLFTYPIQDNIKPVLKEFLLQSISTWVQSNITVKPNDGPQRLVELLSCPEFWSLPTDYQHKLLEDLKKCQDILLLSKKKWSDKTLESLKQILEQPSISWNLLEDVFNIIIDIPVRMDSNIVKSDTIEKTSKSKPDIEAKSDVEREIKIEIEAKREKQETSEAKKPEGISDKTLQTLLIHHLEYCFLCIPWLSLLTVQGEKKPKILIDLQTFVKGSLHKLFQMVQNKTIEFCVCRFLECDNNKKSLKALHQSLLKLKDDDNNNKDTQDDLQKLLTLLKKYKEFVHLKELYVTVSVHYKFDDNTSELQQFSHFCENWDLESFPDAQEKYLKELETLQKTEHQLEELKEVAGSWVFKKLWTTCQIKLNEKMMLPFQGIVNELHKNTFSIWNELKQIMMEGTFQIKDIEFLPQKYNL